MRPPTPAMVKTLRYLAWTQRWTFRMLHCHPSTKTALVSRGWIALATRGDCWDWQLTDEGRRVLAEHPTTGDE